MCLCLTCGLISFIYMLIVLCYLCNESLIICKHNEERSIVQVSVNICQLRIVHLYKRRSYKLTRLWEDLKE